MQHCPKCNLDIRGNKRCCPLCQGKVTGEPENAAFKTMPEKRVSRITFLRLAVFMFLATNVVMILIQILFEFSLHWPWVVTMASIFVLGDVFVTFYMRGSILNLVTIQAWILIFIIYFIDRHYSGYRGYSVAWVIPFTLIVLVVATIVIGKQQGLHTVDYAILILVDVIFSLFQLLPIMNGNNPVPLPAIISTGLVMIYFAYILVFRGRDLKTAAEKYLNM